MEVKSASLETDQQNSPNLKHCESLDLKKEKRGPQGPLEKQKIPNTLLSESQKEKGERPERNDVMGNSMPNMVKHTNLEIQQTD